MLLFDMDGTLIDSNGVWREVDRTFLARRSLSYTHAYYEGVAHTTLPTAAKFTKEFCKLTESCEDIIAEWLELSNDILRPRARQTRRPGVSEAVQGPGGAEGGGDYQRTANMSYTYGTAGSDEIF